MHFCSDPIRPSFHSLEKARTTLHFPNGEKIPTRSCLKELFLELCFQKYLGNRSGSDCGLFSESISSGIHIVLISKHDLRVRRTQPQHSPPHCVNVMNPWCCFCCPVSSRTAEGKGNMHIVKKSIEGSKSQVLTYWTFIHGRSQWKRYFD